MRLLLVEDDVILGETLTECFEQEGIQVQWARTVQEALPLVESDFALAIVDVGLPDGNGFALATGLRGRMPFLFMTARNEAENRLRGFELGAVDYIPKPFLFRELLLRVQRILQREQPNDLRRLGQFHVDLNSQTLHDSQRRPIAVTAKDFSVLKHLLLQAPRAISRDELLEEIWGMDTFPTPRTVDNSIVRLRRALRDETGELIRSVRGVGYQVILES